MKLYARMRSISGILRILCGCGVMAFALRVYLANLAALATPGPVRVVILGHEFDSPPGILKLGLMGAGIIGAGLAIVGIIQLVGTRKAAAGLPRK